MEFENKFDLKRHLALFHAISCRAKPFGVKCCSLCQRNFGCEFTWEDHCHGHVDNLETLECSPTAQMPGMCPFCLGDNNVPYFQRVKTFRSSSGFWEHVSAHLEQLQPNLVAYCPHPLCAQAANSTYSLESLYYHMMDIHVIGVKSRKRVCDGEGSGGLK